MNFNIWYGLTPISAVPVSIWDILTVLWQARKSQIDNSRSIFKDEICKVSGFKKLRTYQSGTLALHQLLVHLKKMIFMAEVLIIHYSKLTIIMNRE